MEAIWEPLVALPAVATMAWGLRKLSSLWVTCPGLGACGCPQTYKELIHTPSPSGTSSLEVLQGMQTLSSWATKDLGDLKLSHLVSLRGYQWTFPEGQLFRGSRMATVCRSNDPSDLSVDSICVTLSDNVRHVASHCHPGLQGVQGVQLSPIPSTEST